MKGSFDLSGHLVAYATMAASCLGDMFEAWKAGLASATSDQAFRDIVKDISLGRPEGFADAPSVVVAALSTPPRTIPLKWRGAEYEWQQPPQYYRMKVRRNDVRDALSTRLKPGTALRMEEADALPLKFLAAWTSLGSYGRNNIIQVPGMGSAITLIAWWCDLPEADAGIARGPAKFMDRCASCDLCPSLCPTGAIPREFGVIDASRCVSLYNEGDGEVPDWVPKACFHATNGCSICQRSCPENAQYRSWMVRMPSFEEDEVASMLSGGKDEESLKVIAKVISADEPELLQAYAPIIAINLKRFFDAQGAA
jgi:epoxyqueuosine reductase QueG